MRTKLITLLFCGCFYINGLIAQTHSTNLVRLSPQPVHHQLNINFIGDDVDKQQDIMVSIYDLLGNLVEQQTFHTFNTSKKLQIDLGELASGMYLVTVEGEKKYPTQRFIKW